MGLDIVELVIGAEETFGISIPDEDASELVTVGLMHDYIMRKLEIQGRQTCISSKVFYTLRRGLIQLTGLERRRITPDSDLSELMPEKDRRKIYNALDRVTDLRLPSLSFPGIITALIWGIMVFGIFMLQYRLSLFTKLGSSNLLAFPVMAGILLYALRKLFDPLRKEFPYCQATTGRVNTVGDLTREIVSANYRLLRRFDIAANPDEVWVALKAIIVEVSDVDPEKITRDARFVQDLGLG